MRKELDQALCEKYPEIFKDRNAPMNHTAMCWGFDCDDGWRDVIDTLCGRIDAYVKEKQKVSPKFSVVATQVKEKFGTLRFYIYGGDDAIYDMIDAAEHQSGRTCEVCGDPGELHGPSWLKTLCEKHGKEMGYEKFKEEEY